MNNMFDSIKIDIDNFKSTITGSISSHTTLSQLQGASECIKFIDERIYSAKKGDLISCEESRLLLASLYEVTGYINRAVSKSTNDMIRLWLWH